MSNKVPAKMMNNFTTEIIFKNPTRHNLFLIHKTVIWHKQTFGHYLLSYCLNCQYSFW